MSLLLGAFTIGLILAFLTLGVFISFKVFNFADITVDGSFTTGAATAAVLIVSGVNPFLATAAATATGMLSGALTGIIHTKFKINGLLSGILVMTALYSVNLHIMGKSNIPLISSSNMLQIPEALFVSIIGAEKFIFLHREIYTSDLCAFCISLLFVIILVIILYAFFKTSAGTAMRATGDSPQMITALGVSTNLMIITGLAISNGLVALSGAVLAQYQGFADVQMGIGMIVWGLASVIIGEALVGKTGIGLTLTGVVMGSIIFRLLVAVALRCGLDPSDLKIITAVFVFAALVTPGFLSKLRLAKKTSPMKGGGHA